MSIGRLVREYGTLLEWTSLALLILALVLSYLVAVRLGGDRSPFGVLRKRFVLGVPWGTLLVVVGVSLVFHVVQGAGEPGGPNVVGFRSWSLWYPQSLVFSSFSHASSSHLTGNMLGTLAFAPLVEYAWSHYPTGRGQHTFSSWRTNPFVRIALFVFGTFLAGILGALAVPGAVIGFSGVVFTFAGLAIVVRPLSAAGAILGVRALDLVYDGVTSPLGFSEGQTQFVTPYWVDTALQGHLFGMVVGVLLGVLLVRHRSILPDIRHIWFAALVFAVTRSMWAIYWFLGASEFVLFRGLGAAAVLVLASLVGLAVLPSDRSPLDWRVPIPSRRVALSVLVLIVVVVAMAGIPYNLVGVSPGEEAENGIEIDGYTVTYAENVEDQYTSIDLPVVGDILSVDVSGVIVASEERNVWALDTRKGDIANRGFAVVVVGDTTWRDVVIMNHTQWKLRGGNTTYKVYGRHWQVMDEQRTLFTADPVEAEPTINGTRVSIRPSEAFYEIVVERDNETLGVETIPSHNETVRIAGIDFQREENELLAVHEQTEIPLAEYRTEREE